MFGRRRARFGRGRERGLPYDMFDHDAHHLAAKSARVLERVYHKGQARTWNGKQVLADLIAEHGPPRLDPATRGALGRVFGIIMWGELAAWRISAELADEIEPLEAKMAATSQAFDEARHFYVMHDYLVAAGAMPDKLDRWAEALLRRVMNADSLPKKLLGMQLMVEPVALALFHIVRQLDVEPVLTSLMPYYERDEARHVALGVHYLPSMLERMSVAERIGLWGFQFELVSYELLSNMGLGHDLMALGLDPRDLMAAGKAKQMRALEMVFDSLGVEPDLALLVVERFADTMLELTIPDSPSSRAMGTRLERAFRALRHGVTVEPMDLVAGNEEFEIPRAATA